MSPAWLRVRIPESSTSALRLCSSTSFGRGPGDQRPLLLSGEKNAIHRDTHTICNTRALQPSTGNQSTRFRAESWEERYEDSNSSNQRQRVPFDRRLGTAPADIRQRQRGDPAARLRYSSQTFRDDTQD